MKHLLIICLLLLITFSLAQGIHAANVWGIIFATCSLFALTAAIYLWDKLQRTAADESGWPSETDQ
ncbi:MAG: hypothetical protein GXC72_14520 [Chitinophagaceae bacterium]|nr:hypothetical protein [Chitinophagaceae bacterium]